MNVGGNKKVVQYEHSQERCIYLYHYFTGFLQTLCHHRKNSTESRRKSIVIVVRHAMLVA
jgi:hypothetical protein